MAPKRTARVLFKGDLQDGRRYELVVLGERFFLELYSGTTRLKRAHVPKHNGVGSAARVLAVPENVVPDQLLDLLRSAGECLHSSCVL